MKSTKKPILQIFSPRDIVRQMKDIDDWPQFIEGLWNLFTCLSDSEQDAFLLWISNKYDLWGSYSRLAKSHKNKVDYVQFFLCLHDEMFG